MHIVPIQWSFRIHPMLNILQIIGFCNEITFEAKLLTLLIPWIEKAQTDFNAQLISERPELTSNSQLSISCQLIFHSQEDINNFLDYIGKLYETP